MPKDDVFEERGRSLEEEFFRRKDAELVAKFKDVFSKDARREEISILTGVEDEEVLNRLVNLHINGQIVTAFHLYPLVEVAWADGGIDARETEALLAALLDRGVTAGSPAYEYLARSLKEGPHPESRKAWYAYAAALKKSLTPEELTAVRTDLLEHARAVAAASGGILNVAFTSSTGEKRVIRAIQEALT